jgi:hypothetical protein
MRALRRIISKVSQLRVLGLAMMIMKGLSIARANYNAPNS